MFSWVLSSYSQFISKDARAQGQSMMNLPRTVLLVRPSKVGVEGLTTCVRRSTS